MIQQKENKLISAFYVVFITAFGWLFFNVIFNNMHFSYSPFVVLPIAILWILLFYFVYKLIQKYIKLLTEHKVKCLIAFFTILALTLLFVYSQLAVYPAIDLERVYTGAYNYTITGVIEDPYLDYFYKYPNNMPLTIVLQFVFRAIYKFGFTFFFEVAVLINGACICLTYLFIYLCCEKKFGIKQGFFALVLMYFCLPIHFYISVFYTDTISMPFIPFALYIYFCLSETVSKKEKAILLCTLFVAIGFGIKLKYSVAIVIVAIFIDILLQKKTKTLLPFIFVTLLSFFAWNNIFNSFMYKNILDEEIAYDAATPFASWIMMSLQGDGTHNSGDNYFIWYFETREEKNEHALLEIRARLEEHGAIGYVVFLNQKSVRSFGSGNMDTSVFVAGSLDNETSFLAQCVSAYGKYYGYCDNIIQGYHIVLFISVIAGAYMACRKKDSKMFSVHLCIFGLYLFLLLWEASQRYLMNYTSAYILACTYAMPQMFDYFEKFTSKKKEQR